MEEKDLFSEATRLLEAGINKHLNKSIVYSPLRLFYNMFKKRNPQLMSNIRESVCNDIEQCLISIENFNQNIFVAPSSWSPQGKDFLRACYNIGIDVLRKKLTVMLAFRVMKDASLRDKIYNDILSDVQEAAINALNVKYIS